VTADELVEVVLKSWRLATRAVADTPSDFVGRDKETRVFRRVKEEIAKVVCDVQICGPDSQLRFDRWGIDLVCGEGDCRIAVEGKYKIASDGAVPDNRKAAFFDLFKLEQYADSAQYAEGVFLWLTNEPSYRQQATGDSADFSTHQGRVYLAGTPLRAARSRNQMPLPLVLKRSYKFDWDPIDPPGHWHSLAIRVGGTRPDPIPH
jgi:hypothetical protein